MNILLSTILLANATTQPPDGAADESSLTGRLLIILLALCMSFFFSASEFAVIRLDRLKVRADAEHGNAISKILFKFLEDTGRFLSSIAIGNTFANLLLSSFVTVTFAVPIGDWAMKMLAGKVEPGDEAMVMSIVTFLISVVTTYLVLVCGELTPKQFAISRGESFARKVGRILRIWSFIVYPIVLIVNASSRLILFLLGARTNNDDSTVTEEQILMQVEYGEEKGSIEKDEKEMIENVFDLNDITAADVMVHRKDMVSVPITATPQEVQQIIRETGFSRLPVYENDIDNIKGVLNSRDLLLESLKGNDFEIKTLMRDAQFVPEMVKADVLFRQMQSGKHSIAIVVDDKGGTSGLVSVEDIVEHIVGDLYDEYDTDVETKSIEKLGENKWRILGEETIDEINQELSTELVEGEYPSLSGYIMERMGTIPKEKDICEVPELGLTMEIERMDERRIDSVLVEKKPIEKAEDNEDGDED